MSTGVEQRVATAAERLRAALRAARQGIVARAAERIGSTLPEYGDGATRELREELASNLEAIVSLALELVVEGGARATGAQVRVVERRVGGALRRGVTPLALVHGVELAKQAMLEFLEQAAEAAEAGGARNGAELQVRQEVVAAWTDLNGMVSSCTRAIQSDELPLLSPAQLMAQVLLGERAHDALLASAAERLRVDLGVSRAAFLVHALDGGQSPAVGALAAELGRRAGAIELAGEEEPIPHQVVMMVRQDRRSWRAILAEVETIAGRLGARILVGEPRGGVLGTRDAYRRAVRLLPVARRVCQGMNLVRCADLKTYGWLESLAAPRLLEMAADGLPGVMADDRRADLMATIQALALAGGRRKEAAARLGISEGTVYKDLERIAELESGLVPEALDATVAAVAYELALGVQEGGPRRRRRT